MELDGLVNFYEENVRHYGNDVRSVAWGSRESQNKRFEVLVQIGELKNVSVLDVGCGLGDLFGYFKRHHSVIDYSGIDISVSMVEAARKIYPQGKFEVRNLLENKLADKSYDYVFASGIFNRIVPNHRDFLEKTISSMYAVCRVGVAFNILSAKADFKQEEEYYAHSGQILDFCLELSRKVILRHDYMTHDFTIYIHKES